MYVDMVLMRGDISAASVCARGGGEGDEIIDDKRLQ